MIPIALLFAAIVVFASSAWGETLTAICKDPKGRAVGVEGPGAGKKPVDQPDGMRGGQVTLIWQVGRDKAQIVAQGTGGGPPQSETGSRVHVSDESATFIVTYRAAVWLYSVFWKANRLLITQHTNGFFLGSGGAIAKSMEAECDISVK